MKFCLFVAIALSLPTGASFAVQTPDAEYEAVAEEYIKGYFAARPLLGTSIGLHEYDGRIGDYSRLALDAELARLKRFDDRLANLTGCDQEGNLSATGDVDLRARPDGLCARRGCERLHQTQFCAARGSRAQHHRHRIAGAQYHHRGQDKFGSHPPKTLCRAGHPNRTRLDGFSQEKFGGSGYRVAGRPHPRRISSIEPQSRGRALRLRRVAGTPKIAESDRRICARHRKIPAFSGRDGTCRSCAGKSSRARNGAIEEGAGRVCRS